MMGVKYQDFAKICGRHLGSIVIRTWIYGSFRASAKLKENDVKLDSRLGEGNNRKSDDKANHETHLLVRVKKTASDKGKGRDRRGRRRRRGIGDVAHICHGGIEAASSKLEEAVSKVRPRATETKTFLKIRKTKAEKLILDKTLCGNCSGCSIDADWLSSYRSMLRRPSVLTVFLPSRAFN